MPPEAKKTMINKLIAAAGSDRITTMMPSVFDPNFKALRLRQIASIIRGNVLYAVSLSMKKM